METLKQFYKQSPFRYLLEPIKLIYDFYRFRILSEKMSIIKRYKSVFGVEPDLQNPKTLNEKIQWLKLNDRKAFYSKIADKYEVRTYITEKIGSSYLPELIFTTQNPKDISPDRLPNVPVAVKTNHSSNDAEIIRDKSNINFKKLQKKLRKRLKANWYVQTKEYQYKHVQPRILVEKLLMCQDGKVPTDFKVHCFNGKPTLIYVTSDREGDVRRDLYTTEWENLPFIWSQFDKDGNPEYKPGNKMPTPKNLSNILRLATVLSEDFKGTYVRVDLYNVDEEQIYFGELTLHHMSGLAEIRPKKWDEKLGEMLRLPI